MKLKDVYIAQWKEREWGDQKDHCFEGLLVVMETKIGLMLVDTYWGINSLDQYNQRYTIEQAQEKFDLKFYCNLDDIEKIYEDDQKYYNDNDIIFLHTQHACVNFCKYYYIKKGSQRNKEKMISTIKMKIEKANNQISWAQRDLEEYLNKLSQVESDNLNIYI